MKLIILGICFLCIGLCTSGQKKWTSWSISITNAHTAKPFGSFSKLSYSNWHPGFEAGRTLSWRTRKKQEWFQTFNAGYFYHRWVQHTVSLYSELGYKQVLPWNFSGEIKIGAGYLHAVADSKIYKIDGENGLKRKTNLGRPQAMASFSLELQKSISKNNTKIFLDYQQRLQLPFVKNYILLLPYNILKAGVSIPINKN